MTSRLFAALAARYTIERELGHGGMAIVYLAHDRKQNRHVAIKVLRPELSAALGTERFLREIEITGKLVHPHILPLLESDEADGFLYYVMPYVEGETLRDRLERERQLPLDDAVQITTEVADALSYAQSMGVIHRDIKPENIFLVSGKAVIGDFGIARAVSEAGGERLTETGIAMGTPAYMSPEQAVGWSDVDARSDIYSLGCVLYEMLGGETPFGGTTPQNILARKVTDTVPSLRAIRNTVPPEFENVVMKALARSPADRFATATQFIEAVKNPAAVTPVQTYSTSAPAVVTPTTGAAEARTPRRAMGITVGALAVAVLGAVGATLMLGRPSPRVGNRVVVTPFENRTNDPALERLGTVAADMITRGVLETGILEVVSTSTVLATTQALKDRDEDVAAAALPSLVAQETGASIIVSGSYHVTGDSIRIQSEITEAEGDRLVASPEVAGSQHDPTATLETLTQQVMVQLTASELGTWVSGTPSSFEAYSAWAAAFDAYGRGTPADRLEAKEHIYRALEFDPMWPQALLMAATTHMVLGEDVQADSFLALLEQDPAGLSLRDRRWADWVRAVVDGDRQAAYRAVQGVLEVSPGDPAWLRQMGNEARMLNRPREALEWFGQIDPESALMGWRYWLDLARAHHMLGQHRQELRVAKRAREQHPNLLSTLYIELTAQAALGRRDEVDQLLLEAEKLPPQSGFEAHMLFLYAGQEFHANGDTASARAMYESAIASLESLPLEQQATNQHRLVLAELLMRLGRWADGDSILRDLASLEPENIEYLGFLAMGAAALGHEEEARRLQERIRTLDVPSGEVRKYFWRAAIAARLGEPERAVSLLREVLNRAGYDPWLHRTFEFSPLWNHPGFQTLLRPIG